jgi:hypothetical protein
LGTEAEKFGPLSIQVEERLRGLDDDLSYFMDRLRKANMEDMVNIVLLSGNYWIEVILNEFHTNYLNLNLLEIYYHSLLNYLK